MIHRLYNKSLLFSEKVKNGVFGYFFVAGIGVNEKQIDTQLCTFTIYEQGYILKPSEIQNLKIRKQSYTRGDTEIPPPLVCFSLSPGEELYRFIFFVVYPC